MNNNKSIEITILKNKINESPEVLLEQHIAHNKNPQQSLNIDVKDLCKVLLSVIDSEDTLTMEQNFSINNILVDELIESAIDKICIANNKGIGSRKGINDKISNLIAFKEKVSLINGLSIMIISIPSKEINMSFYTTDKLFNAATELLFKLIKAPNDRIKLH